MTTIPSNLPTIIVMVLTVLIFLLAIWWGNRK